MLGVATMDSELLLFQAPKHHKGGAAAATADDDDGSSTAGVVDNKVCWFFVSGAPSGGQQQRHCCVWATQTPGLDSFYLWLAAWMLARAPQFCHWYGCTRSAHTV